MIRWPGQDSKLVLLETASSNPTSPQQIAFARRFARRLPFGTRRPETPSPAISQSRDSSHKVSIAAATYKRATVTDVDLRLYSPIDVSATVTVTRTSPRLGSNPGLPCLES